MNKSNKNKNNKNIIDKLESILHNYILNIECLSEYIESVNQSHFCNKEKPDINKMLSDLINEENKDFDLKKEPDSGEVSIKVTKENINIMAETLENLIEDLNIYKKDKKKEEILYRSSLMNLVVFFETMIGDVIRCYIDIAPDAFVEKKSLTFKQIKELGGFENATEFLIENEMENIIRGGYKDWMTYIHNKMDVSLDIVKEDEEQMIEAIKRRNLFVHNDGKVNNIYLKDIGSKYRDGIKKGKKLRVDSDYMKKTILIFKKIGYLILLSVMKKLDKQSNRYWGIFERVAFNELKNKNYELSECIYEKLQNDKMICFSDKLISKINYLLSIKYNEEKENIKYDNIDMSALADRFKTVIYFLNDDLDNGYKLLEKIVPNEISLVDLESWPVFDIVRNEERFRVIIDKCKNKKEDEIKKISKINNKSIVRLNKSIKVKKLVKNK